MKPLDQLGAVEARRLRGVLFDLDDTVLDHGCLTLEAYEAVHALRQSGLRLLGITGRPASWGHVLIRQWPVDAMVTENGTIALLRDGRGVRILDRVSAAERRSRSERLRGIADELQQRFPTLRPTEDAGGRLSDFTFDVAESQQVDSDTVKAAADLARERGARVLISSIHMHLALDEDDKATGALRVLRECFGEDSTRARFSHAFIGDSENDASCFAAFACSVGVRNLTGSFSLPPRYQTTEARGQGFCEFVRTLLRKRAAATGEAESR